MAFRRKERSLAVISVLLAVSCSSSSDEPEPTPETRFDGVWVDCSNDGFNDFRDVFTVSGTSVTVASLEYLTTDGSCGGEGTEQHEPSSGTATLGPDANAWLDSVVVQATPVDLTWLPYYSIFWRDTAVNPHVLYTGDDTATAGLDGSAPDKRPNVLQTWRLRYLQTTPSAADLNGTWLACKNNGLSDEREVVTISGGTLSVMTTEYSSTDDSCTGTAGTPSAHEFAFTVGDPVYSTLGTMTVSALSVDAPSAPLFSVMWVDTRVTPNLLYTGDELATPGYDGSEVAKRTTVLQASKPRVRQ